MDEDEIITTQKELANRLGISQPRVSQLIRKGLPRNPDGTFSFSTVKLWAVNRASEKVEELLPTIIKSGDPSLVPEKIENLKRFGKLKDEYKGDRANILAGIGGKMAAIVGFILNSVDPEKIKLMLPEKQLKAVKDLVSAMEDLNTQERLERGESTENVAIIIAEINRIKNSEPDWNQ